MYPTLLPLGRHYFPLLYSIRAHALLGEKVLLLDTNKKQTPPILQLGKLRPRKDTQWKQDQSLSLCTLDLFLTPFHRAVGFTWSSLGCSLLQGAHTYPGAASAMGAALEEFNHCSCFQWWALRSRISLSLVSLKKVTTAHQLDTLDQMRNFPLWRF